MPHALRTAVLGTRTSSETKARFAALAAAQGLSESALLGLLVDKVLAANSASGVADPDTQAGRDGCARDRLTVRLRPGDRALADTVAAARRMKTSSYLAMLVRAHVRRVPVMPPAELDALKSMAGHLSALGRQIRAMRETAGAESDPDLPAHQLLLDVGTTVESVREAVAGVVRSNLSAWETGQETGHA